MNVKRASDERDGPVVVVISSKNWAMGIQSDNVFLFNTIGNKANCNDVYVTIKHLFDQLPLVDAWSIFEIPIKSNPLKYSSDDYAHTFNGISVGIYIVVHIRLVFHYCAHIGVMDADWSIRPVSHNYIHTEYAQAVSALMGCRYKKIGYILTPMPIMCKKALNNESDDHQLETENKDSCK